MKKRAFICFFALAIFFKFTYCYDTKKFTLNMPNMKPSTTESFLCAPFKVDSARNYYVTGFDMNSTARSHHMTIYGCTKPGSSKSVWECGQQFYDNPGVDTPPCAEGPQIMYGWAEDYFGLPEGVGFKIGGDSPVQYIVLQVHYSDPKVFKMNDRTDTDVHLYYTTQRMDKQAGVIVLASGGSIPAGRTTYLESACSIKEYKTIHPFAYATHTHSLGTATSGYVVKPNNNWIELGKKDPQERKTFLPVTYKTSITYGDTLVGRCTMKSTRDRTTYVGKTEQDEMCRYYIMYYVDEGTPLNQKICYTPDAVYYSKEE
ncbi:PREDICTED: peptidylglycine alpha-hydroxylating monooxygenase-like [Wasmannia auropunctata]|uniref:peptidylglycine alpha-hydroxylating monooxygenase-like n=1 Tax=Wasmannia auropunctata TaxID=64793 RepID=UPI0005EE403A|nr:PREDICTED: peptidylglycine alpha-hydroxylating monooxygenase-like [Wasmannia auropunctata]